jgi:orotidine-5'-phosphate decarboxylase
MKSDFDSKYLKNGRPLMLALDLDDRNQAVKLVADLADYMGAVKVGPRLLMRYGAELVADLARHLPVFVDNKYLDIPNTMEAAVRATFEAGATFTTVHAWAGPEALQRLAKLEIELNKVRPFKILVVTILTSFNEKTLPPGMSKESIASHVTALADLTLQSGLSGLVCSPHEVSALRQLSKGAFLVVPGIRLPTDAAGDQKRIETPDVAIRQGASALVVGRPIYEAVDPVLAAQKITESIRAGEVQA